MINPTASSNDTQNNGELGLLPLAGQSRICARTRRARCQNLSGSESIASKVMRERPKIVAGGNVRLAAFKFQMKASPAI
jgi:hypothetical protein